ncbi:MAG TPA: CinA family protein [Cyclobacteriaceae bacterium]|nr:CinA family protein [Cyclobacteriaceae bacterium]
MISPDDENVNSVSDRAVSAALDTIKHFCFDHNLSVAVAESVSSGFLQVLFSSEKEAGLFFEGGITAYSCKQKARHLEIPFEICDPCNGVALEIAQRLALNVCDLFDAKIGLSLTGYASPIPEENIYELYAFGAVALNGRIVFAEKLVSDIEDPDELRQEYAKMLVTDCAKTLKLETQPPV